MVISEDMLTREWFIKTGLDRRAEALTLLREVREAGEFKVAKKIESLIGDLEKLLIKQGAQLNA